jgi:hypothetical protein
MPRFRRPSPALVLAIFAVVIACSSSAGADPVAFVAKALSGSKIKKHSIPLSALSASAVKALKGAPGPTGPAGAAAGTNATVVTVTCATAPCQQATAACPAGTHLTGGGGLSIGNMLLFESRPAPQSGTPNSWEVAGGAADPPAQGTVTAYAICAS